MKRGRMRSTVRANHSRRAPPSAKASSQSPALRSTSSTLGRSSASGMRARYCWFMKSALRSVHWRGSVSEKVRMALERPMPSRVKAWISSSVEKTSRSSPGDQPSRARKLRKASGRKPRSR